MTYQHSFAYGSLKLPSNIFYAPLAGCSNYPFRQITSYYNPGLIFCEMVKMEALARLDEGTLKILDFNQNMHPIGAQLCGSNPQIAGFCAKLIEDMGFDVIDLNCGCPVDKVTKDGSGSGMLKRPHLIGDVISEMVSKVKIPVTVKIRAGWDEQHINCVDITKIAEEAGATAICIHGRTRAQGYRGLSDWNTIKACKEAAKNIKVIGNGDVVSPESAKSMFEHTNCDGILIGRATLGQPWICEQIRSYYEQATYQASSLEDIRTALILHFEHAVRYLPERKAIVEMRKVGPWYLKQTSQLKSFKISFSRLESLDQAKDLLQQLELTWNESPTQEVDSWD